jgi:hypothetical protein
VEIHHRMLAQYGQSTISQSKVCEWVERRHCAVADSLPGAHPASYTKGTRSFLRVNGPQRGVDHPPQLALRLKKE